MNEVEVEDDAKYDITNVSEEGSADLELKQKTKER